MRVLLVSFLALAPASPAMAQLLCDGLESGGTGALPCGTQYAYIVETAGASQVQVGTDDCNPANYTNWCQPDGWLHPVISVSLPGHFQKTPHGVVSTGPGTPTACIVEWQRGPGELTVIGDVFGFDHAQSSRDVGWLLLVGPLPTENWGAPVGLGSGPVHGPQEPLGNGIPTVSEWGLIVMTLLALTAGTIVFARRRRPTSLEL